MAKSMRSKREKRLRAIRREMVEPLYEKKEEGKRAALEAALAAPKLPVRSTPNATGSMDTETAATSTAAAASNLDMDVEMAEGNQSTRSLKPIGKRLKKKLKLSKRKYRGKGKIRKKNI